MKLIALAIALAILPIHKSFTGSPESSSLAPAYTAGQARYFNLTPGGMQGNLVVVRENGLPGLWNNTTGAWQIQPGGVQELFFATSSLLFYTSLEGRAGYGNVQPGFEESPALDSKDLYFPFPEASYYPSRTEMKYICLRMEGRWAVLGADGFLLPGIGSNPQGAISILKGAPRKAPDESNEAFILREFREMPSATLHGGATAREKGTKGLFISLVETPYAGPYFLPDAKPDASYLPEYGIFGVRDGVLTLAFGCFINMETGNYHWYEDLSVEEPYIPLNSVSRTATHWDPNNWKIPIDMSFREFYFAYEFNRYVNDPDYDEDEVWEEGKYKFLRANSFTAVGSRYPMMPEAYDPERKALKLVIAEDMCPPFYVPMTAREAQNLIRDYNKYGPDELVWWYERGIDNHENMYVSRAGIGWPDKSPGHPTGKIFHYSATE